MLLRELKPCPFSGDSELLVPCQCFPVKSGDWGLFPGKSREAFLSGFVSHTPMWEPVSVEPVSQPAFFSPGLFRTFFPSLLPPWCEFVVCWFSWAQRPSWAAALFVVCTDWDQPLILRVAGFPKIGTQPRSSGLGGRQQMHEHQAFQPLVHREESCRIILCTISNTQICSLYF